MSEKCIFDEMILTWEDIKDMKRSGMYIGSHTNTHRILSNLPEDELEKELCILKSLLEHHLGDDTYALSYPFGSMSAFNDKVKELSKSCGYKIAFSYRIGLNKIKEIDALNIKRIGIEYSAPFSYLKSTLIILLFN